MYAHGTEWKLFKLMELHCNALGPWGTFGNLVEPWVTLGNLWNVVNCCEKVEFQLGRHTDRHTLGLVEQ